MNLIRNCFQILDNFKKILKYCPPYLFYIVTVFTSLIISLLFFSPKYYLWDLSYFEAFETSRAYSFILQCAEPFAPREDALKWRLILPITCNYLGLTGFKSLIISWIGVLLLLFQCSYYLLVYTSDRLKSFLGTMLIASTSPIIVSTNWLGMNDCFYLLMLGFVGFSRNIYFMLFACVLGPFFDERFLIGLPLAMLVRYSMFHTANSRVIIKKNLKYLYVSAIAISPYIFLRAYFFLFSIEENTKSHISYVLFDFNVWFPWSHLGWWMAYRLGWILIVLGLYKLMKQYKSKIVIYILISTYFLVTFLSSDTSRSASLILPLLLFGLIHTSIKDKHIKLIVFANLFVPALHVTYTKVSLISPIYIEVFRLIRKAII